MWTLVPLFFLALPALLMWWMLTVQRRVRARMREQRQRPDETRFPEVPPFEEGERAADGLSYGRAMPGEPLRPAGLTPEIDGIQALQGRR
jgi:hypothetical protein